MHQKQEEYTPGRDSCPAVARKRWYASSGGGLERINDGRLVPRICVSVQIRYPGITSPMDAQCSDRCVNPARDGALVRANESFSNFGELLVHYVATCSGGTTAT